jgi:23S rRNA (cytidine1920-2'-O)/16S rRNA (cytidine1409-2'-O)-methyltransferase
VTERLDRELVRRGLARSRSHARALINAGQILVDGSVVERPGEQVASSAAINAPDDRYVSRAAHKLIGALDDLELSVAGRALDAGASTGGFTDCVLQRGVSEVVAVDVGYGQLHERLRADPRVIVRDRTNVRHLRPDDLGAPVDLVVGDLSFISLALVLAPLVALCRPGAPVVLLVKPQFEAGRQAVGRGRGIISDPAVWHDVLDATVAACAAHGVEVLGLMASPLTGAEGNVEFLLHGRAGTGAPTGPVASLVEHAVTEAAAVGRP